MSIRKITNVDETKTIQNEWWFLYNDGTKVVIESPLQCSGYMSSPYIMVIGDTEEELLTYIEDNDLIVPAEIDYSIES